MACLAVDVCEWSVCWIGESCVKRSPTGIAWGWQRPASLKRGPCFPATLCPAERLRESLKEESGLLSARCGANRLWTLHLVCWVISKGWSDLEGSGWRRGATAPTSPINWDSELGLLQDYGPISLLPPLFPTSDKAPILPAAWRRGATEFLRVNVVSSVFLSAGRAKTPETWWKCAVDRGQTGPDLLEEAL